MHLSSLTRKFITGSTLVAMSVSVSRAQSIKAINDSIDHYLSSWNSNQRPGISVTVVKNGKVVYAKSLGMARIKEQVANDSLTRFWIASVTKQFTAAAIYRLSEQKKIALDSSVRKYVTGLPALFQPVTINYLIHHTSGIRDGFVLTALSKKPSSAYTNENVLHYLGRSTEVNFAPGSRYEYNNSGYVLLATIIERVTGRSYADYIKEQLFSPLGMKDTYVSPTFPKDKRQAEGYRETAPDTFAEYHFEGNTYGSTGIVTTLYDLAKWSQFLQNPASSPALASVVPYLLKAGKLTTGKPIAYAGGLEKFTYNGNTVYEHFGSDEGFKAEILYLPDTKVSVIGLTNNNNYYGLQRLLYSISDLVTGKKVISSQSIEESSTAISELLYYDPGVPELRRVQNFNGYKRIGNTPSGYTMPYITLGDTLRSADPIPSQYLVGNDFIETLDPDYSRTTRMTVIHPMMRIDDLKDFSGEFRSGEIETTYKIIAGEKGLQFEFAPGMVFDLYRLTETDFVFDYQGPNYLQFSKNGFHFSREGCRKLVFQR